MQWISHFLSPRRFPGSSMLPKCFWYAKCHLYGTHVLLRLLFPVSYLNGLKSLVGLIPVYVASYVGCLLWEQNFANKQNKVLLIDHFVMYMILEFTNYLANDELSELWFDLGYFCSILGDFQNQESELDNTNMINCLK